MLRPRARRNKGIIMSPNVPPGVVAQLSLAVQPLVFETGIEEYPYSTSGTVFLVWYDGKPYVITTRHGLNAENPSPICVFPSDTSLHIMLLSNVFFVSRGYEAEDYMDLAVIEVDNAAMSDPELNRATLIDLALASEYDWEASAFEMDFFLIGYPHERSNINYHTQEMRTERVSLFGKYGGESPLPYLHLFIVDSPNGLETFSGFSGSPVFAWRTSGPRQTKPVLCGMAIRGTPSSGLVHFLPIAIILDALKVKRTIHEHK
jgi:hypothetical protein